jgi:Na+/melibiose symporter-like transporter
MVVVTAVITVARIFDAINDPVMGSVVDMTRTRWGKLRPYILFSALPVAVLSTLLFTVPDVSETGKLVFFAVCYVLWAIAYTVCDVPFWGLIGSAFSESGYRMRVISNVRAFGGIALGLATLGMPWVALLLSSGDQTTGAGWSLAVGVVSVLGMGLFLLAFTNTRERYSPGVQYRLTFRQLFGTLLEGRLHYALGYNGHGVAPSHTGGKVLRVAMLALIVILAVTRL